MLPTDLSHNLLKRKDPWIYFLNVGVNSSHRLISPVFEDRRFEFVPIPEGGHDRDCTYTDAAKPLLYEHLQCFNTTSKLLSIFPSRIQDTFMRRIVHYDPNLNNPNDGKLAAYSYGDLPFGNARAATLRNALPGDVLLFIANLCFYDLDTRSFLLKQRGMYFVGYLEIKQIVEYNPDIGYLSDVTTRERFEASMFDHNAHVNHLLTLPGKYKQERFTIFEGTNTSARFTTAVPLTKLLCDEALLDTNGDRYQYDKFRSLNSCIGAYTRTVRPNFKMEEELHRRRFKFLVDYLNSYGQNIHTS